MVRGGVLPIEPAALIEKNPRVPRLLEYVPNGTIRRRENLRHKSDQFEPGQFVFGCWMMISVSTRFCAHAFFFRGAKVMAGKRV